MIFEGDNRVRYPYSRFGWTRGGGKTWHGGLDIEGLGDTTIRMPAYCGKSIRGRVVRARIVTNRADPTWEWGYYITVQLDQNQTPDRINYLIFAHCARLIAAVGQAVQTGDALAAMGNTGNAALADPPYAHVHFECRATLTGCGLDPTAYAGIENAVGTYTQTESGTQRGAANVGGAVLTVKNGTWYLRAAPGFAGVILGVVRGGERYEVSEAQNGWYHLPGGWLSGAGAAGVQSGAAV